MKTVNELVEDLRSLPEVPCVFDLIELAYGERVAAEHRARSRLVLRVRRAKAEAGMPRTCRFFDDVWPQALAALKEKQAE